MLLTTVLLLAAIFGGAEAVCDAVKFDMCQQAFAKDIGVNVTLDWTKPLQLQTAIQNAYINGLNGKQGLVGVCNAYNLFMFCLYNDGFTYRECFDPIWLLTINNTVVSPLDAQQYVGVMAQVSYQCGAGFYPAIDNWACVQSAYQNQNSTLTGCVNTFFINSRGNPDRTCEYFKTGLSCYENAFRFCHDEIMYYGCESFRIQAVNSYPGCKDACQVRQNYGLPGMKIVNSERYVKYEERMKNSNV
ncbi:unnamed protein product, partial [Mesorhabditis belari]|uniref:Uncharacterized protein n=1 Tax=Mesorhabditis belari TaxID=2138241 RepID=A0AAF3FRH0_9BILA